MPHEISVREDTGRRRVRTVFEGDSKTMQSERHRSDIHEIIKNYNQTGVFMSLRQSQLQFRDVTHFEDYADMAQQTKQAEAAFMTLPSKLREIFNHDVHTWLDAAHDQDKLQELTPALEKAGFLKRVLEETPAPPSRASGGEPSGDPE